MYCFAGMKSQNKLPSLQQLQLLQQNVATMEIFCEQFLSCNWQEGMETADRIKQVQEIATVTDEAFALLILNNI